MDIDQLPNPEHTEIFKQAINHLCTQIAENDPEEAKKITDLWRQTKDDASHDSLMRKVFDLATEQTRSAVEVFWETYGNGFIPSYCVSCKKHRISVTGYFRSDGATEICPGFCLFCGQRTSTIRSKYLTPQAKAQREEDLKKKEDALEQLRILKKAERKLISEKNKAERVKAKALLKAQGGKPKEKASKKEKKSINVSTEERTEDGQKSRKRLRKEVTSADEKNMAIIKEMAEKLGLNVSMN